MFYSPSATIVHKLGSILEFHLLRIIHLILVKVPLTSLEFLGAQLVVSLFDRGALRLGPCVCRVEGGTGIPGGLRKNKKAIVLFRT
jgi:hypothetical protein